jgi:hypothetical protein
VERAPNLAQLYGTRTHGRDRLMGAASHGRHMAGSLLCQVKDWFDRAAAGTWKVAEAAAGWKAAEAGTSWRSAASGTWKAPASGGWKDDVDDSC